MSQITHFCRNFLTSKLSSRKEYNFFHVWLVLTVYLDFLSQNNLECLLIDTLIRMWTHADMRLGSGLDSLQYFEISNLKFHFVKTKNSMSFPFYITLLYKRMKIFSKCFQTISIKQGLCVWLIGCLGEAANWGKNCKQAWGNYFLSTYSK